VEERREKTGRVGEERDLCRRREEGEERAVFMGICRAARSIGLERTIVMTLRRGSAPVEMDDIPSTVICCLSLSQAIRSFASELDAQRHHLVTPHTSYSSVSDLQLFIIRNDLNRLRCRLE